MFFELFTGEEVCKPVHPGDQVMITGYGFFLRGEVVRCEVCGIRLKNVEKIFDAPDLNLEDCLSGKDIEYSVRLQDGHLASWVVVLEISPAKTPKSRDQTAKIIKIGDE